MKKSLLLLFAAFTTLLASAKVKIDGIYYYLNPNAQTAEVTSGGSYSGSITIPTTVTYDGVECRVTSIGEYAFSSCYSLTTITLPASVTSIGWRAFSSCSSLTVITIPENSQLTSIGESAFSSCESLTAITIPEVVTSIGDYAFYYCESLTDITIPENSQLTSIGESAFYYCWNLTDITIPEGVTSIGDYAFYECRSLTTINIPEGVTSIGRSAFWGCESLTTIVLPKSLKNISSETFANCSELLDVYCYAEKVPSAESDVFDGSYPEYVTLHVPANALNAYKTTAPWSRFGNIVVLEDEEPLEKCATPTISYVDGKVVFACDTEGATIKSSTTVNGAGDRNVLEFDLIPTYTITAYATKEKYEDSDVATVTLCWIPCTEEHEENNGILTIPSKPVLISTQGGTITVSGLAAGTAVAAYSTVGTQLATATATDGTATLATGLEAGNIAIVKMGDYSIRIAVK